MLIKVKLHSALRTRLPAESKGATTLDLPEDSDIAAVIDYFDLPGYVLVTINGQIERERGRRLREADKLDVFLPASGG